MFVLNGEQLFTPIEPHQPLLLGRGLHGIANDDVVSREHARLELQPDSSTIKVTQIGRHPIVIYRLNDLPSIGWVDVGVGQRFSHTQLAARSQHGRWLKAGESEILHVGDAFGISTRSGVAPFWITKDRTLKVTAAATPFSPSPASAPLVPVVDSLSLTPPLSREHSPTRHGNSPQRHVSCSLVSPSREGSIVGPTSQFYQSLNAEKLERVLDEAIAVDERAGLPKRKVEEDAMPVKVRLEVSAELEAERLEREQAEREQAEWSLDQYPESKRRKILDARDFQNGGDGRAHMLPMPSEIGSSTAATSSSTTSSSAAHLVAPSLHASLYNRSLSPTPPSVSPTPPTTAALPSSATPAPAPTPAAPLPPPTFVMPPLSVLDFHFSPEKANPIALSALRSFFTKHPNAEYPDLRITLVIPANKDGQPTDGAAKEVYEYFQQHEIDPRFGIRLGDLTDLGSLGIQASYLVHPTTWRFVGGEGGRINKYMFDAFAERLTTKYPDGAKVGWVYVTAVPHDCELAKRCPGLATVLTLRPPNMNDARPDSLNGNYLKGCKELTTTYSALFMAMAAKLKSSTPVTQVAELPTVSTAATPALPSSISPPVASSTTGNRSPVTTTTTTSTSPNLLGRPISPAITAATARSTTPTPTSTTASSASSSSTSTFVPPATIPVYNKPASLPPKSAGHFSLALYDYIKQPRAAPFQSFVFWEDSDFVAIYDVYPKARIHLLLLPKKKHIDTIFKLTPADLPFLDEMDARGKWLCENLHLTDSSGRAIPIRRGFHAVPSLKLLHLHIISQEFDAIALKNKKHWNSFCTSFFIQPNKLKEMILQTHTNAAAQSAAATSTFFTSASASARARDSSHVSLEDQLRSGEKLLAQDLRCHRIGCGVRLLNMPELQQHLKLCQAKPYPFQTS